jgi:hypothetical protein
VGDEDDGLVQTPLERGELALERGAGQRVERAERLVHEEQRRVCGERARHAHALALPAGKLRGEARPELVRVEPDQPQQLFDARAHVRLVPTFERGDKPDVAADREVREESRVLYDVARASSQLDGVPRARGFAFHQDFARGRLQQSVDEPQRRRLSAPRLAEQHQRLAAPDFEVERVDDGRRHARRRVGDAAEVDDRVVR